MEAVHLNRFAKRSRLTKAADFALAKAEGRRKTSRHFVIYSRQAGPDTRLGLAVSRKVGKAHDRNRLKRRLRELFRARQVPFADAHDYFIVAKLGAGALDFLTITSELAAILGATSHAAEPRAKHQKAADLKK